MKEMDGPAGSQKYPSLIESVLAVRKDRLKKLQIKWALPSQENILCSSLNYSNYEYLKTCGKC